MALPDYLPLCDPNQRQFPSAWKEAFFRRHFDEASGGYVCPGCNQVFCGPRGLLCLHSDHIVAWSKGGETVWENMNLLCYKCNIEKSNTG